MTKEDLEKYAPQQAEVVKFIIDQTLAEWLYKYVANNDASAGYKNIEIAVALRQMESLPVYTEPKVKRKYTKPVKKEEKS